MMLFDATAANAMSASLQPHIHNNDNNNNNNNNDNKTIYAELYAILRIKNKGADTCIRKCVKR